MKLTQRLRSAVNVLIKGSIAPFDRVIDIGGGGVEKVPEPYRQSLWVARAIKHVVDPITTVSLKFGTERKGDGIEDAALDEFWQEPAIGPEGPVCFRDVVFGTIGWLKLAGEAFWVMDDAALVAGNLPFPEAGRSLPPFLLVRPDRMRHVTEDRRGGRLIGWEMTDAAGRKLALLPEQVVHSKLWNPYDDIRGLGEYEQARIAAESDYLGANFKLNIARNNGDQGVYVIAKSGIPDDAQRKQIVAQLREKREMQQRGQFKPVFLTGDISIEDPKIATVDEAFLRGQADDAHRIFIAFGVPPSMADVVPSYSIGSASDYWRLIRDTCMPSGAHFCETVETYLQRVRGKVGTGQRLYCWLDWAEHPVMKEVRKESAAIAAQYWDRGVPWEVLNEMLDLGLPEFEGWETSYLPFSVSPASTLPDGGSLDGMSGADTDEPIVTGDNAPPEAVTEALRALRAPAPEVKARNPREVALWRQHLARRKVVARAYHSRITRELFKVRAVVLKKLAAAKDKPDYLVDAANGTVTRAAAADFLFDLADFTKGLNVSLRSVTLNALQTAGEEFMEEIHRDDPFSMPDPQAMQFLAERANKLSGVGNEIWSATRRQLQEGLDKGESIAKLSDRIRGFFNETARGRAERIAMTETGAAYGVARQQAMREVGVQYKKWLTSGLDNVRPAHAMANGQTVLIDEPFFVGGEALDHPGDPSGSAGNVINCHCVSVASELPPAPEGDPNS